MAQSRRFQVQFEVSGDGKVKAEFLGVAAGAEKATQAVEKAGKAADSSAKQYAKLEKEAKAAGAVLGLAVAAGLTLLIRNTIAAENEQAQLAAVLRSTGEAAGYSQLKLNDMASAMSQMSTLSAGEITDAQVRLLSYSAIVGENFPRALQLAIDQSTRLGESVSQSAETVGKALEYPAEGVAALTKQGFRFTEEQKKMLKVLEETGRLAEAQAIVMGVMEESYAGAAQAARDTLDGALKGLMSTFNDLMTGKSGSEGVVGTTQAINDLTATLNSPEVIQGFDNLVSGATRAIGWLAKLAATTGEVTAKYKGWLGSKGFMPTDQNSSLKDLEARRTRLTNMVDATEAGYGVWGKETIGALKDELVEVDALIKGIPFRAVTVAVDSTTFNKPDATKPPAAVVARTKAVRELTQAEKDYIDQGEVYAMIVGMTAQAESDAVIASGELMKAAIEAKDAGIKRTEELIADMEFELSLIGLTNDERERAIALRYVDAEATGAQIDKVDQLITKLQAARREEEFKSDLKGLFVDIGMDLDRASESVDRFFDNLKRRALQALADAAIRALFGQGADGKKSDAGFWANFAGNLAGAFDGKREMGGPVRKGSFYEVAEGGKPELLHDANGRTFLIPGSSGTVVPAGGLGNPMMGGGGGGMPGVVVTVENHGAPIEVQRQETQRAPDGRMLARLVVQTWKQEHARGEFDSALSQSHGLRRQGVAGG